MQEKEKDDDVLAWRVPVPELDLAVVCVVVVVL